MVGLMGPYTYLVIGYDPERHNFTHDECGNIYSVLWVYGFDKKEDSEYNT
jgi:hypothetical protein